MRTKVDELIEKYNLKENSYYTESPYLNRNEEDDKLSAKKEAELLVKWKDHIPKGWYGFSFGTPTPHMWFDVIDEFLEYVKSQQSDFQILQIKIKFSGVRIYLNNISEDIQEQISKLEEVLSDKFLIY